VHEIQPADGNLRHERGYALSRTLRIGFAIIAVLLIGLFAAAAVFVYTADYNRYKGHIAKAVMDATGRQLEIKGDVGIKLSLPPALSLSDVTLANAPWSSQPHMAHIGQLRVRIRLIPLLLREIDITGVRLIDTDLLLETDASGRANWQFGHQAGSHTGAGMRGVAIKHLEVEQLAVTLRSAQTGAPAAHYQLDRLELNRSAASDSLAVELHGSLNGQPVALSGQTGPLRDLFAGVRFPLELSGEAAGATIKLYGGFANALTLAGLDLTVEASGSDLATLGTGIGVKIPHTDSFDVTAQLTGNADQLALQDAHGSVSYKNITLALNGVIGDLRRLEDIQMQLKGSGKDLAELGSFVAETLPATGPFELSGKLTGTAEALVLSEAQGTIGHQSIELALAGSIGDLIALEGIDLNLKSSGDDLAEIGSIAGKTLPQTGPFSIRGKLTGTAKALALSEAQGTISRQSVKVSLAGSIGDLIAVEGIDLNLQGSGGDLAELSSFVEKTLPNTGPFSIRGRLTGTAKALALSEAHGTISDQSIKLSLTGRINDLMAVKGISLNVKGTGKNLGELRSMISAKLPDTGPFSATGRLTGSARAPAVSNLRATLSQGSAQLAVSGKVGDVLQLSGIDLDVNGAGKNLGELGPLFDTQLPDLGPFSIKGQLSGSDTLLELHNFSASVDHSDFAGWAQVEFGKRLKVTTRLKSGLVDFTRIMEQAKGEKEAETANPEKGETSGFRQTLFSDAPLPFDVLDAVDADIAFNARNLKARDAALEFGQLVLRLDAGELRVDKLEATYEGTKVSANLDLTTGTPATVAVRFLVQGFDLGRFLKETHVSQDIVGHVDVAADLRSRGNSPHSLMAHLDGTTGAVIGKGYVPRFLDLLAQDLSRRVISVWGHHKEAGALNCGVIQFTNRQGIGTSDAFLFDTQLAILKGDGEINLATEQLDFVLSPKPKDYSLFSLATKLRVSGSVLDPKVRPDMRSVATKGAKALSSLVLGPAGLLVPFMSAGARNQHPCDIAALKSRVRSIYE
jgi:uncharacterized protein involved in outer membrane biogenesis